MDEGKCTSGTMPFIISVGFLPPGDVSMEKIYYIIAAMFACHTMSVQARDNAKWSTTVHYAKLSDYFRVRGQVQLDFGPSNY